DGIRDLIVTGVQTCALPISQLAQAQAAQEKPAAEKKVKDQGEYDIYNQTLKDLANPAALLKDLDTWSQKYPDSDWKDDRLYYYRSEERRVGKECRTQWHAEQ